MAKSDYQVGDVKYALDGKTPISEVERVKPYASRKGTTFRKQYEDSSALETAAPLNVWHVDLTDSDVETYAPFNRLEVHNVSNVDIDIRFNGSTTNKEIVAAGTIKVWGKEDGLLFYRLDAYNRSGVTEVDANDIIIIVARVN